MRPEQRIGIRRGVGSDGREGKGQSWGEGRGRWWGAEHGGRGTARRGGEGRLQDEDRSRWPSRCVARTPGPGPRARCSPGALGAPVCICSLACADRATFEALGRGLIRRDHSRAAACADLTQSAGHSAPRQASRRPRARRRFRGPRHSVCAARRATPHPHAGDEEHRAVVQAAQTPACPAIVILNRW